MQANFEIYIEEQLNVQRNDILIDDMYYQNKWHTKISPGIGLCWY